MTILLFAGFVARVARPQSRLGHRLVWCGAALYLVFLLTPLAEVLYARLEHPFPPVIRPDPSVRTVVVLSAYGENISFLPVTSKLSLEMVARMVEGIRLYRELPGAKLLVSGGISRAGDPPVAELMAEFARAMGVPGDDIVVEGNSSTTFENLVEVMKILPNGPFLLVTSSGEMRRAVAVARKLGMAPIPAPAAIWAARYYPAGMSWTQWGAKILEDVGYPTTNRFSYLQRIHHEYVGYFWYWVRGRV